jgi:glycosyltransferase involved in cell wall biosynthesis
MPKVSVIVPTHNRALALCRAVDSILNQTFRDLEVLIIDDASTDHTADFVADCGDNRVRYFRHDQNRGEGASRNTGLLVARGEYIAFLDDDDVWLADKLAKQVALLDGCAAQVGGIYTGYFRVELESGKKIATVLPQERGDVLRALCGGNCIGGPSVVLLRRSCFDRAGRFDEDVVFGLDYDMWIRIAHHYRFEFIREPLVLYSVHNNRLSANNETMLRGKEAQLARYGAYFASDPRAFSRYWVTLGVLRCYNRRLAQGRAAFWRAIRTYPLEPRAYFNALLSLLGTDNFIRIKELKERIRALLRAPRSLSSLEGLK